MATEIKQVQTNFRFNIGDLVTTHRGMDDVRAFVRADVRLHLNKEERETRMPIRYEILGRMYEECPGGVQYHYRCKGYFGDRYGLMDFNDVELIPWSFAKGEAFDEVMAMHAEERGAV